MKRKKRKLKKKVIVLLVLIVVLICLVTGLVIYMKHNEKPDNPTVKKVVDKIPEYGYVLESNKTKLYQDLFKYAKLISQMAVADFYNLDNKASKNDIGGTQFIREKNVDNFVLEASETVYKYVEQNLDGTRKQELPIVTNVEASNIKQEKYKYKDISDDKAYIVTIKTEYKKDLGYPKQVIVKLLHNDKKLEIYYMK